MQRNNHKFFIFFARFSNKDKKCPLANDIIMSETRNRTPIKERNSIMWKKLINLVTKSVKKNEAARPVRQLRPVEQYVQLTLPLDF